MAEEQEFSVEVGETCCRVWLRDREVTSDDADVGDLRSRINSTRKFTVTVPKVAGRAPSATVGFELDISEGGWIVEHWYTDQYPEGGATAAIILAQFEEIGALLGRLGLSVPDMSHPPCSVREEWTRVYMNGYQFVDPPDEWRVVLDCQTELDAAISRGNHRTLRTDA